MIKKNKMDNIFGPSGNVAGIIVFIAGLIMTYFSLTGLILILTGAFVGFTSTGTLIDFNKKRVKYSVIFFGFIPIGKWTYISPDMKIIIKKINKVWRTYSWSNRTLDNLKIDYRLILFTSTGKEILPLQKFHNFSTAEFNLNIISKQLDINTV